MPVSESYKGVFPVVPTPFFENQEIDFESQRRVIDCIIDQGVDGLCILANYSEQFLLSDEERNQLLTVCLNHVNGRIPVVVTCSNFSTKIAVERAKKAVDLGAKMLMFMPPYHGIELRADERGIFEHFEEISLSVNVPIMVQDATLSGVPLRTEFLKYMVNEIEHVKFMKIEVPNTADKIRELNSNKIACSVSIFDGENSITLWDNLRSGAIGTMPSAMFPELLRVVVDKYDSHEFKTASIAFNNLVPLINFELHQCGIQGVKTLMKEGGVINSDIVRHPLPAMHSTTREELIRIAREYDLLVLKWGKG